MVRLTYLFSAPGIGFRDSEERDFYFWPVGTDTARQVTIALQACGPQIDDTPRQAKRRR